jgi:PTH1 family peptidyl-tRNA hydrolase
MKYLIAGLGNIGSEYVDTRHNVGFMVLNRMMERFKVEPEQNRHAFTATIKYKGRQLFLVLPTTYMNLSGKAVRYYLQQQKVPLDKMMVVTDDISLPFGTCRMRPSGSDGGHNGLKSIQELLGTAKYPRLKFGVGDDFNPGGQADYVLSPFTDEQFDDLPPLLDKCVEGILSFASIGLGRTMNGFNARPKKKKQEKEE